MKLMFEKHKMSNEEFNLLDESLKSYTDEYGYKVLAPNNVFYFKDIVNEVIILFTSWLLQSPEDRRQEADIGFVDWNGFKFRFYFQIFYIPENNKYYGEIRDVIWTVFKIEIVENDIRKNILNDDILVKKILNIL